MTSVALATLLTLPGVLRIEGDASVQVAGVTSDSRRVQPGDLFAAIAGAESDGASFAAAAIARGARAVLADRPLSLAVPVLLVDDVRRRLGAVSHAVFGEPTAELCTAGITGTNGKTTVAHLLEAVLLHAGRRPALLGTVAMRGPASVAASAMTTPEADVLARFARSQRDAGATDLVMEVSSHALELGRVSGVRFAVAGFTNLTQDHLDFHATMERYGDAKARLFTEYGPAHSVLMIDQPFGEALAKIAGGQVLRCSLSDRADADVRVIRYVSERRGLTAEVATKAGLLAIESPLFGAHNMENLLVCIGMALAMGVSADAVVAGLRSATGAPGRMERVADPRGVLVLVDYAHTPDAVERALSALRPLTPGRLFVVCGCGGDRDRIKRAPMGEAAVRGADLAVLTSDNPRSEDPLGILADMEVGAARAGTRLQLHTLRDPARDAPRAADSENARGYVVVADRADAIALALRSARAGDTVLLSGKGHEDYQMIGRDKRPFDDRAEARRAIAALAGA